MENYIGIDIVTFTDWQNIVKHIMYVGLVPTILGLGKLGKEIKRQERYINESNFKMGRDPKKMLLRYG